MKTSKFILLIGTLGLSVLMFSCDSGKKSDESQVEEQDYVIESIDVPELDGIENMSNYTVDVNESFLVWRGKSLTDEHVGGIKIKSGHINFEIEGQRQSQALIVVDMNSITCTDIEDKDDNEKLVDHLKNEDFFEVSEYPEAKIQFSEMMVDPNGIVNATGFLTVKGITRDVNVNLDWVKNQEEGKLYIAGYFMFDRAQFDIRYKSTSFFPEIGDKYIEDEIGVEVMLALVPKATDAQEQEMKNQAPLQEEAPQQ